MNFRTSFTLLFKKIGNGFGLCEKSSFQLKENVLISSVNISDYTSNQTVDQTAKFEFSFEVLFRAALDLYKFKFNDLIDWPLACEKNKLSFTLTFCFVNSFVEQTNFQVEKSSGSLGIIKAKYESSFGIAHWNCKDLH